MYKVHVYVYMEYLCTCTPVYMYTCVHVHAWYPFVHACQKRPTMRAKETYYETNTDLYMYMQRYGVPLYMHSHVQSTPSVLLLPGTLSALA
jgi:hypothetical protein